VLASRRAIRALGLNHPENVRRITAGDTAQDIIGGKPRIIQEVGDVVRRNPELPEAMKEVGPATRPRSPRDIVLDDSTREVHRRTDLGIES